ncbi:MAG: LuxR C-terminal-related transcriptional regulator [Trueperaceae bacterium]
MNVHRRLEQLSTLNRILEILNEEADFNVALRQALEELVNLLELSTGWVFLTRTENAKRIELFLAASVGLPPALADRDKKCLREGGCNCHWYFQNNKLDTGVNIIDCSRLDIAKGNKGGLEIHASMPLLTHEGPVGILNLASPGRDVFDEEALTFLTAIGRALGLAFRRAVLQEHYIQERETLAKLEERAKLARDIQHSVTQLLANAGTSLKRARQDEEALERSTTLVTSSLAELNTLGNLLQPSALHNLTPKETEVLASVAKGLTNKAIAKELGIAEKTVKTHVSSVLSKLNLKTRTSAALWAKEQGL